MDVEISRWNEEDNADVQFLVQQGGKPKAYRFYSSRDGAGYDQGGHWYNFTWNPGQIDWSSSSGGGQEVTLTTSKALDTDTTDFIQCLPGKQVDVRMNLWNMLGSRVPEGLEFFDIVEVVISKFEFQPSGETHVPEVGACSKNCQCEEPNFKCVDNRCVPKAPGPDYVPPIPGTRPSTPFYCGCPSCRQAIWDNPAPTFYQTCGERITWYQKAHPERYPQEEDACLAVAREFPCSCGSCSPTTCNEECVPTPAPTLTPTTIQPPTLTAAPTTADIFSSDLYCFPDPENRVQYSLWEGFVTQVKQLPGEVCGPGSNRFSDFTVAVTDSDVLRMQFARGTASEVRVLLPSDRLSYGYGTYSFSIQSVLVLNDAGAVISNELPPEMVFAMFTWEDKASDMYHNEVSIKLSRTGIEGNPDLLFSTAPSGYLWNYV